MHQHFTFSVKKQAAPQDSTIAKALLFLYLVGTYTMITIYSGNEILLPAAIPFAVGLLAVMFRCVNIGFFNISSFYLIVGINICHIIFVGIDLGFDNDLFKSLLQLIYSIVLSMIFIALLRSVSIDSVENIFYFFVISMLMGCFAEKYLGLDIISDYFRSAIYPNGMYDSADRDIEMFGGVRPRLFTLEPSWVGFWFSVFLSSWFMLKSRNNFAYASLVSYNFFAIGLFLIRSPTLLAFVIVFGGVIVLKARLASRNLKSGIGYSALVALLMVLISTNFIVSQVYFSGSEGALGSESMLIRLVVPFKVMSQAFRLKFLYGFGLGNYSALDAIAFGSIAAIRDPITGGWSDMTSSKFLLTNSFYLHFIFYGFVFGGVILYAYARFIRELNVFNTWFVFFAVLPFWFSIGGYLTLQPWVVFVLFIYLCGVWESSQSKAVTSVSSPPLSRIRRSSGSLSRQPRAPEESMRPVRGGPGTTAKEMISHSSGYLREIFDFVGTERLAALPPPFAVGTNLVFILATLSSAR